MGDHRGKRKRKIMKKAALTYAENGVRVFPCNQNKAPLTITGFHDATLNPDQICAWWRENPNAMIGVPTGDFCAIDIDAKNDDPTLPDRFDERCKEHQLHFIDFLPKQRTPSGNGLHYFFKAPPDLEIRNRKLARKNKKTTIETRGKGGYVCIAPSAGYYYERGKIWDAPTLTKDQVQALFDVAKTFSEEPEKDLSTRSERVTRSYQGNAYSGLSPGDDYDQRGDVPELLRAHGWHAKNTHEWRRPGKNHGISATWDRIPNRFYCFSSNAQPLEPETAYSPFALFATLEHGGNFAEAARELARLGYGETLDVDTETKESILAIVEGFEKKQKKLEERLALVEKKPDSDEPPRNPFTDLKPFFQGDLSPEKPTVAAIQEGGFLFYAGRLNEIHAEPSVGKTNIVLASTIQVLQSGGTVLFIDPEDTPTGIVRRLVAFGLAEKHADQIKYLHNPDPTDLAFAVQLSAEIKPELVIADGLAELLAGHGLSEDKPLDLLPFFRRFLRPFAENGAAVVISDHVTKDSESRGRWSRGSGAKIGRYDGAVYEAKLGKAYGPGTEGFVKLIVSKDRNGGVGPFGYHAANIVFRPDENDDTRTDVSIVKPSGNVLFRPTEIMKKVMVEVAKNPTISKRELRKLGKSQYVEDALTLLEEEGFIKVTKGTGRNPNEYTVLKPYHEPESDSNGRVSTVELIGELLENIDRAFRWSS